MKNHKSEKGQALIIITFAIIGLIGLTGLAVDGGMAYANQRKAQSSADTAAYAAALAKIRGKNADQMKDAAKSIAAANGGSDINVEVNNPPGLDCKGKANSFTNPNEYIQVIIKSKSKTSFGTIVGVKEVNNCAEAITHATPYTGGSFFNGSAVVAVKESGTDTFMFNGSSKLHVTGNSGIMVNSNTPGDLNFSGGSGLYTDTGVVSCNNGTTNFNGGGTVSGGTVQDSCTSVSYSVPTDLPTFPEPPAAPTCVGSGSINTTTHVISPGTITDSNLEAGNWTMSGGAGAYCFTNGLTIKNGATLTITGIATTVWGGTLDINNGGNLYAYANSTDGLIAYFPSGSSKIQIGGTLHAYVFRYYGLNSAFMGIDGGGTLTSEDAYMYNKYAAMQNWNGNSNINLTAPTSGDYKGLVFYQPYTNTNQIIINGSSTVAYTGTMYMPGAFLQINGSANYHGLNGQVVANTVRIDGNNDIYITYDAGKSPTSPVPPTITLVK
jgi:Flp pilus assembly protein TadG